jgi:uncharacterized phage protein (TIGR02220 family)
VRDSTPNLLGIFFLNMEKLQWFKFTPTDWVMGKIQRCPEITQARFMRLICLYWNKECVLNYEDAEIEIDKEHLEILINKKIIKLIDDFISIEFLNEQLFNISETSEKRRQAVLQRWNKVKQNDTSVLNNNTIVLQNDTDKIRKEKENNINLSVNWIGLLEQFNLITNKKLKVIDEKTKRQVIARLKDGYTKADLLLAITNCFNDDYHKENPKYLTLEFITRPDKMQKYCQDFKNTKPTKKIDKL